MNNNDPFAPVVLGYVARFDGPDGKEFRPLTFWRSRADSATSWRWASWPAPRPLYGLRRLAERPSAPVIVAEGEKAADAAARLLLAFAAITSPNGSKSCDKADWSPLRSRSVTIWPDADAAGLAFAKAVARAPQKLAPHRSRSLLRQRACRLAGRCGRRGIRRLGMKAVPPSSLHPQRPQMVKPVHALAESGNAPT